MLRTPAETTIWPSFLNALLNELVALLVSVPDAPFVTDTEIPVLPLIATLPALTIVPLPLPPPPMLPLPLIVVVEPAASDRVRPRVIVTAWTEIAAAAPERSVV